MIAVIKSLREITENVCGINIVDSDVLRQCGTYMFWRDRYSLSVVPLSALNELAEGPQTTEAKEVINFIDALRDDLVRGTVDFDCHYLAIGGYTPFGMESPEQRRHISGTYVPREAGTSLLACARYMQGLGLDLDVLVYSNSIMTRMEATRQGFEARYYHEKAPCFGGRIRFASSDAVKYSIDPGNGELADRVVEIANNAIYAKYHASPYHAVIEADGVTPLVKS